MQTEDIKKELTPIQQKREFLKLLSKSAAVYVEQGDFATINEAIINTAYKNETHKFFKTFNQWKAEGFFVKKGETAFVVWGRPTEEQEPEESKETNPEHEGKFFPLAFLFSNAQVQEKGAKKNV
jgi:homospermidine synthase